jgi:hypothetical protein
MVVMAVLFPAQSAQRNASPLEERAARQQQTYWRVRMRSTLEKLEREARRMLQLEAELTEFADRYYQHIGDYAERLTELETQLQTMAPVQELSATTMTDVQAQREMKETRQAELKTRYRQLAKEIHPDRSMLMNGMDDRASKMQQLNVAYQHGDLATLLRLEAEMLLSHYPDQVEDHVREVDRAADTYAAGYRQLLNSPINELMLRALSARLAGWDWMDAVVKRVQRAISESERQLAEANIAAIGDWRQQASVA